MIDWDIPDATLPESQHSTINQKLGLIKGLADRLQHTLISK